MIPDVPAYAGRDDDGMTEQTGGTATAAPGAPATGRPPLTRPRHGRLAFGVCAGLGRTTDIDPVIYRVVVVVLTIFGGIGVLLYALGWLLIPEEGADVSEADRLLRRHRRRHRPRALAFTVGVIAIAWLASVVRGGHNLAISVILLALLAYLLLRDRGAVTIPAPGPPPGPAPDASASPEAGTGNWWSHPTAGSTGPAWQPPPVPFPPRPPRSRLGWIALSAALVVVGALVAAREGGVGWLSVTHILAAAVLVVGLGLVVGSLVGRARWLVLPGGALAAAMLALVGIGVPIDGGIGDRTWHPTSVVARSYHLGIGHATLDLRDVALDSSGPLYIDASVAIGQLEVLVPNGLAVWNADARAGLGHVDVFNTVRDGVHPHVFVGARQVTTDIGNLGNQLVLRLRVGAGDVEVRHVAP